MPAAPPSRAGTPAGPEATQRPRTKGRRAQRVERHAFGYLLLTPQVLGFLAFAVIPLAQVFFLSTQQVNVLSGEQSFVALDNYRRIFTDPRMPTIMTNTAFLVIVLSVSGTALALLLAILVNQKLRFINVFRAVYFIPALVTLAAWTIVWKFILQPGGFMDAVVGLVGAGPVPWLRSHWIAMSAMVVVQLLKNVGINMMILLAALQSVSQDLVDAGRVDGANRLSITRHITIPQISPSILMVLILMIVGSFKVFEQILLLTNGGPGVSTTVLSFEVYRQAFGGNDIGYASALAVVLFMAVLILTALVWQGRKRWVHHEAD